MSGLTLTRRHFESIVIEGGIEITVVSIQKSSDNNFMSGHVKLRIQAPGKKIYRKEIVEDNPELLKLLEGKGTDE